MELRQLTLFILSLTISSTGLTYGLIGRSTIDIIEQRGFTAEYYPLISDGAELNMYRIINPLANPQTLNKYPVLYGHGVLYNSMSMLTRSEKSRPRKPVLGKPTILYENNFEEADDRALPFMLSNNNFDVWMFDARGSNQRTRNASVYIDPFIKQRYWDFSLDDEALVDLPLMIDFVLAKTGAKKVVYVGYSQSTFFMFALLSTAPEYSDKIAAFVALAPVAYVSHIKGLTVPILAPMTAVVPDAINLNIIPQPMLDTFDASLRNICKVRILSSLVCGSVATAVGGNGASENAPDFFEEFYKSTSVKVFKQFFQLYNGKRFGMYDYGQRENLRRYGQAMPPAYDLSRIRSDRIILARGQADFLSTPEDQLQLITELTIKPYRDVVVPQYNHFDFIDGRDLVRLINGPVLVAVFDLLYRDGPTILRDTTQVEYGSASDIQRNADMYRANKVIASVTNDNVDTSNILMNPVGIIASMMGGQNVMGGLSTFLG